MASYNNVRDKWFPEIKHHCPDTPILLVGTKLDMRDAEVDKKLRRQTCFGRLYQAQGWALASEIGAAKYLECSAMTNVGLSEVFQEAANIVLQDRRAKEPKKKRRCVIL